MPERRSLLASPRVAGAWRRTEKMTVSEWADKYRTLTKIESPHRPGEWDTDFMPYLRKPMDAYTHPAVEWITLSAASRVGKSELLKNCFAWTCDKWPRNALIVQPDRRDATEFSNDQLRPLFKNCPRLAGQLPRREKGEKRATLTAIKYSLVDMTVYIAWATSASSLSMRTIGAVFLDEVRGFPASAGGEGDPVDLARKRADTFAAGGFKVVAVSSPGVKGDSLSMLYGKSDRETYRVPCPHCGEYQALVFSRVKVPEGERDTEKIRAERLAWYQCVHCEKRILDRHRRDMNARGIWVPEAGRVEKVTRGEAPAEFRMAGAPEWPRHVGFGMLSSLYSPWPRATFSETIARFFEADPRHGGSLEKLRVFVNTETAEEWEEKVQATLPEALKRNMAVYEKGEVPDWALILTAFVDVQLDRFFYIIRAWGEGWRSRLVRYERIEGADAWDRIETDIIRTPYAKRGGETMTVRRAGMDARFRKSDVKEFCRRHRAVFRPTMGYQALNGVSYEQGKTEKTPRGVRIPGTTVWKLDTTDYKDKLKYFIDAKAGEDGEWTIPRWSSEEYIDQITAEHKVMIRDKRTGKPSWIWVLRDPGLENHFLDDEVGNVAMADMENVGSMSASGEARPYRPSFEERRVRKGSIREGMQR